jgi:hypothetical protein
MEYGVLALLLEWMCPPWKSVAVLHDSLYMLVLPQTGIQACHTFVMNVAALGPICEVRIPAMPTDDQFEG